MPVMRVLFMLVVLQSTGYVAGVIGGFLWYFLVRLVGLFPLWLLTIPLFLGLAWLFGWLFGRWSNGPSPREMIAAWALNVPAALLMVFVWQDTTLIQAAIWAVVLGGVFTLAGHGGIAHREAEARYRGAPV